MAVTVSMTLNGEAVSAEVDDRTLLVDLLRNERGLTGTHVGCDTSQCGACVVLLNGRSVKSWILGQAIPGCQSIEKLSDTEFAAKMLSKVGPVKARFATKLTLTHLNPPASYTIAGEGQGGVAGFAKGSADVTLEEDGRDTVLRYSARLQTGGKLAQVGSRLLGATARKMANSFFSKFAGLLTPDAAADRPGD